MNRLSDLHRKLAGVTAVLAVLVLLGCSATIESGGGQTRALIDRVPAGATAIGWLDFEALAQAMPPEEWDRYEEMFQDDEDMQTYERFIEATGIDPRQDLAQVAFAALPTAAAPDDFLMLMSASFDRDKLEALAADADSVDYEGVTFYASEDVFRSLGEAVGRPEEEAEMDAGASTDPPGWIAILDDRTIAMGTEESLRVAVDVDAERHDTLQSDAVMSALVSEVSGAGQIWFVATRATWEERIDDLGQGAMVPTNAIDSIETMTLSLRMGDGMTLRLAGVAGSAEAAAELTTSLNGLMAMGRMMLQQSDPDLFEIIDRGISVRQDDRTIRIEADLTQADIETLQRMAEEQMPSR